MILQFGGNLLTIQNGEAFVAVHHHSYFACQYDEVYELQFWWRVSNALYIKCQTNVLAYIVRPSLAKKMYNVTREQTRETITGFVSKVGVDKVNI